jgi:mannose-6-phosphate isomerase class I
MSPFKATLGFEPTSPTTATFEDNEHSRTLPEQVKILVEMHRFARDCVRAAQAHMQDAANQHRLPQPFTYGDKVKLKATNLRFVHLRFVHLRFVHATTMF